MKGASCHQYLLIYFTEKNDSEIKTMPATPLEVAGIADKLSCDYQGV